MRQELVREARRGPLEERLSNQAQHAPLLPLTREHRPRELTKYPGAQPPASQIARSS